ncbi:MAG: GSCFA domain-containing protein [Saprospiraceae bacterium]|nr:GSCFA domain-containing protein [Saprospiraceae bacterium]
MIFRTELNIKPSEFKILHQDQILLIGSCFSENIGSRLQKYKINSSVNPFGTIYDPISLSRILSTIISGQISNDNPPFEHNGIWYHPNYHSSISATSEILLENQIRDITTTSSKYLKSCQFLFLTLGTAIGFRLVETNNIVANCHKMPASLFSRSEISVKEGFTALEKMIGSLIGFNKNLKIILTISPVRHTKSGIVENSRSKARLTQMVHYLQESYPEVSYFPSFEWMMDDLRDYRYYEKDLVHPNEFAIDYIWEKFSEHYFDEETNNLCSTIHGINTSFQHRPFHPESPSFKEFCVKQTEIILQILKQYPHINFGEELSHFQKYI